MSDQICQSQLFEDDSAHSRSTQSLYYVFRHGSKTDVLPDSLM